MSSEEADSNAVTEKPIEAFREMKRRACERLSSLIQAISSSSSVKRSKTSYESFSTYKALIKSYKFELWAGNEISPRELAVHGWECIARDRLQCIACKKFLCTSLPKITEVDISVYSRCMRRIREQIVTSHVFTCIYRSKPLEFMHGVDEEFLDEVVRPRLSSYNSTKLSKLNMVMPDDLPLDEEEVNSISVRAAVGASLGWALETETLAEKQFLVAVCDYCGRSFMIGFHAFDPVKSHQRWCPILDVNGDDGLPLWKLILKVLTQSRKKKRTSSHCEVEAAKRVLNRSLSVLSTENTESYNRK